MAVHRALNNHAREPGSLDGRLLTPEHSGFDNARRAWNLSVDQRPAAIATTTSAEDVITAVDLAKDLGLRVAAQGTGHGAAALGALEDTMLVKTGRMHGVHVDPSTRVVRVEAGVTWAEAVQVAGAHGLALLAGSAPDVGVVGYTLGGGLSWLGRKHGLACNNVEAIELVGAEGHLVRADPEHEPDLFWALRGGGGSFGVVTAIELRALPISEIYAGALWWPTARGDEVMHCWRELADRGLPDELTTIGRYLRLPDLPEVPEPLRGRAFVVVEAFHLGEQQLLCPGRQPVDSLPVVIFDPSRQQCRVRHTDAERQLSRRLAARQFEQRKRIAVRLGHEPIPGPVVEGPVDHRRKQRARGVVGQALQRQLGKPGQLRAGALSCSKQNGHRVGQQPPRHERKRLYRGAIEPLRVVDHA